MSFKIATDDLTKGEVSVQLADRLELGTKNISAEVALTQCTFPHLWNTTGEGELRYTFTYIEKSQDGEQILVDSEMTTGTLQKNHYERPCDIVEVMEGQLGEFTIPQDSTNSKKGEMVAIKDYIQFHTSPTSFNVQLRIINTANDEVTNRLYIKYTFSEALQHALGFEYATMMMDSHTTINSTLLQSVHYKGVNMIQVQLSELENVLSNNDLRPLLQKFMPPPKTKGAYTSYESHGPLLFRKIKLPASLTDLHFKIVDEQEEVVNFTAVSHDHFQGYVFLDLMLRVTQNMSNNMDAEHW